MITNTEDKTVFPKPFYYLVFHIESDDIKDEVKNLFSEDPNSFKYFLEHEKGVRFAGWDLDMSSSRYKIDLEGIENMNRIKRIRAMSNGGLIIQGSLTSNFLCWGGEESKKIKPLAIIEFTYNAVVALKKMIENVRDPKKVSYVVGFVGLIEKEHYLPEGCDLSGYISRRQNYFQGEASKFEGSFEKNNLPEEEGTLAYKIIEKVYRIFNFPNDEIPFVSKDINGENQIDIETIKKIR